MASRPRVVHYFDYKSPYAYLAQQATDALEVETRSRGIAVERIPYTLDIPSYLGEARLDESGRDVIGTRNAHQWRRVRYAYMDCRREAARRGLVIRGPRKIFDSSIAHVGFLSVARAGRFSPTTTTSSRSSGSERSISKASTRSRRRSPLPESAAAASPAFLAGVGRELHDRLRAEAEAKGVFGVPSYLVDDELFWGSERIERVRERISEIASS